MLRDGYRRGRDQIRQLNRRTITAMNADKLAVDLVTKGVIAIESAVRWKAKADAAFKANRDCYSFTLYLQDKAEAKLLFRILRRNLSEADWRRALAYARRLSKNHTSQQVAPVAIIQTQTQQEAA